jgi:hypothetical protein
VHVKKRHVVKTLTTQTTEMLERINEHVTILKRLALQQKEKQLMMEKGLMEKQGGIGSSSWKLADVIKFVMENVNLQV